MTITPGSRLGVFEILSALGAGGMGEVYRARDTKLNRDVAIKVLPQAVAADPERLARFKREAQLLASLNHPNIGAIHGLEERLRPYRAEDKQIRGEAPARGGGGAPPPVEEVGLLLILELVEGPTLADRITQGAIPIDEALPIARQVAAAVEAAHDQGIVHRDLKPANIKVRPDGTVKVLDFGLAKALAPGEDQRDVTLGRDADILAGLTQSPTLTSPAMTQAGFILGTAAYMAPEQARGRAVDRRADIWAFGAVLYEMLTGRQCFAAGDSVSDAIASILKSEPDWSLLPADTPPHIRKLLQRCLQKDRQKRLPHIGVARMEIDEVPAEARAEAPVSRKGATVGWVAAGVLLLLSLVLGALLWMRPSTPVVAELQTFSILPPDKAIVSAQALSPNGRSLVLAATVGAKRMLWVRDIGSSSVRELPGTDLAADPFWSPDGRSVAFFSANKLKRVALSGGTPQILCDVPSPSGGAWGADDVILFAKDQNDAIYRVPATGGAVTQVTTMNRENGEISHGLPNVLPDGQHFLFSVRNVNPVKSEVRIGRLGFADTRALVTVDSNAVYAATPAGDRILFVRDGTLLSQSIDSESLTLKGPPVPVIDQPVAQIIGSGSRTSAAAFSVSSTGMLALISGSRVTETHLVWKDRRGQMLASVGEPAAYGHVELSPDGTRALVDSRDRATGLNDIAILDVASGLVSKVTFDPGRFQISRWSPDGQRFVFARLASSQMHAGLYTKSAAGGGETVVFESADNAPVFPSDWSRDGRIVFRKIPPGEPGGLWTVPVAGGEPPTAVRDTESRGVNGRVSPNGRWLAYQLSPPGTANRWEVYVQTIPPSGQKWQLSNANGGWPRWGADGKELFFLSGLSTRTLVSVPVFDGASFQHGAPVPLFEADFYQSSVNAYSYDVSRDGRRVLVNVPTDTIETTPITIVLNWFAARPQ